jgi:hypothetical protein
VIMIGQEASRAFNTEIDVLDLSFEFG